MNSEDFFKDIRAIELWSIDRFAQMLDIDPDQIDVCEDLINYGLDSMQAINISAEIEAITGIQLPATLIWDHPSIKSLSEYLYKEMKSKKINTILANIQQLPEDEMNDILKSIMIDVDSPPDSFINS